MQTQGVKLLTCPENSVSGLLIRYIRKYLQEKRHWLSLVHYSCIYIAIAIYMTMLYRATDGLVTAVDSLVCNAVSLTCNLPFHAHSLCDSQIH